MENKENKKCYQCKKLLNLSDFSIGDRIYSKCHICRQSLQITSNKCETCSIRAIYNYPDKTNGIRCKTHSLVNMVDIKSKKCIKCKTKQPVFNYKEETIPTHCKGCADVNMVDIKSKKCIKCKTKIPVFNYKEETIPTHCKGCADVNMVDIKNKKCIKCKTKRPVFNYKEETIPTHCKGCADVNMVDITHKKCDYEKCNTQPYYGFCGQLKTRCAKHKICNKMYVKSIIICKEEDCKEISTYGKTEPEYCFNHCKEDDVCLIGKKCIRCCREDEILDKNDLCLEYCSKEDIDKYIKRIIKKKETMVLEYLNNNIDYKSRDDDTIKSNNIGKKYNRPDRIYEFKNYIVIIEIDENQHKGYHCVVKETEMARMYDIGSNILETKNKSTIFVRFNPDNYRLGGKIQKYSMPKRLDLLLKWVKYFINEYKPKTDNDNVKYIKLFYDEFSDGNVKIEEIDGIKIMKIQNN